MILLTLQLCQHFQHYKLWLEENTWYKHNFILKAAAFFLLLGTFEASFLAGIVCLCFPPVRPMCTHKHTYILYTHTFHY